MDDDDSVPLFGPVAPVGDDKPPLGKHELQRCRNCLEAIRDDAVYCDRCGAKQDVPKSQRDGHGAPWIAILVVGLLVGVLVGGAATVHFVTSRIDALENEAADLQRLRAMIAELERKVAEKPQVVYVPQTDVPTAPVREEVKLPEPAPVPTEPLDTTPAGLRARFGPSILRVIARDESGAELDEAPCFACGEKRVVATLGVLAGAASLVVVDASGVELPVTGVAGQDAAFDLSLLEVTTAKPFKALEIPYAPIGGPVDVTWLGPVDDSKWREATGKLQPGRIDRISGGPRYGPEPEPKFRGVAIDAEGRVFALQSKKGTDSLPTYPAAPLAKLGNAAVPLEFFLRSSGPGAPAARLKRVRQLIDARQFEEAVRLMLALTAEEPRLLPDVATDLSSATLEIARDALANGTAANANAILTEVLQRLPEDAELWTAKGRALAATGDLVSAIACFNTAAVKNPMKRDELLREGAGLLIEGAAQRKAQGLVNDAIQLLLEQRRFFPSNALLRARAGDYLMEARRFEEAAQIFGEAALVDPKVAGEMRVKADRARDLAGGPGAIVIDFQPGDTRLVVSARINGSVSVNLLLDPTEKTSVLPASAVVGAGYSLPSLPRIKFHTDPQQPEVPTVQLASIVIGNVSTARVPAVVVDGYAAPYAEGVLGEPFLSRFRRVEDASLGRLVLYPR